jgi:hypothetical protein
MKDQKKEEGQSKNPQLHQISISTVRNMAKKFFRRKT